MGQCENSVCPREATVEREVVAPFSMSSTSTQTKKTIKLCQPCADQDARLASDHRPGLSASR